MTKSKADNVTPSARSLVMIGRFERAARNIEMLGAKHPDDHDLYKRAYVRARKALERYIGNLENPKR